MSGGKPLTGGTTPSLWGGSASSSRGYLGIDTFAFRGSVSSATTLRLRLVEEMRVIGWQTGEINSTRWIFFLPSGARLSLRERSDLQLSATVEASLPKILSGSNFVPLPLTSAMDVVRSLYGEVGRRLDWEDSLDDLDVMRVDATGHINQVTDRDRLLRAIAYLPVHHLPPTSLRHDHARGGAQTLSRGPGRRWKMTVYDKEREVEARAARCRGAVRAAAIHDLERSRGVLRCELVLRRPVLRELGVSAVRDLNEDLLSREHRRRFHEVGLGLAVVATDHLIRRLVTCPDLTAQARMTLVGVVMCDHHGLDTGLKADVVRKYRKLAMGLGIVAGTAAEAGRIVRLDYDLACQVAEIAA